MAAGWRGRRACSHVSGIGIPHTVPPPLIDRAVSFGQSARSRNEHQMYIKHMKDKFCMIEQSPESMAAARRWNTRKLLSSCFCRQVFEGARPKDEHSKSGKPPLMPASALGIEKTRFYFVSFVAYLEFRILFCWKCFEMKMPRRTR